MAVGDHHKLRNTQQWRDVREQALERDGYVCVRCGSSEELQIDHIHTLKDYPDLAYDLDNLQTLCHPCHVDKGKEAPVDIERAEWINPKYADAFRAVGIL